MTEQSEINWPEALTINRAKKLAKKVNRLMGIGHGRALHAVAVRYGFPSWETCRAALETESDRAEKIQRATVIQQRRARKWADGNAKRRQASDALANAEPGWVGKRTTTASIEPGSRPADATAAVVLFHPNRID